MIHKPLACLVLLSTTCSLTAQFFVPDQSIARRMTRVTWLGESGEQSIAIDYGQPKWGENHEKFMQGQTAQYARLGNDAWTTLQSGVDLAFGTTKVPRGRWYLGAHRDEKQNWTLTLMAVDKIDVAGLGAGATIGIKPDLEVPMRLEHTEQTTDLLDIRLSSNKQGKENVTLSIAWGKYRLRGDLVADFDARKAKGAPDFALSAPDKVMTTSSGLQYEQLRAGVGEFPGPTDKVTVHYCGWLTDGTQFDSGVNSIPGRKLGTAAESLVRL
ncbi:MAG: DUF2911 domain-containing protein [Planctomycetota bacterium]|nr:DUF2911 domain-containing protein [Planctomycetota bacterium]